MTVLRPVRPTELEHVGMLTRMQENLAASGVEGKEAASPYRQQRGTPLFSEADTRGVSLERGGSRQWEGRDETPSKHVRPARGGLMDMSSVAQRDADSENAADAGADKLLESYSTSLGIRAYQKEQRHVDNLVKRTFENSASARSQHSHHRSSSSSSRSAIDPNDPLAGEKATWRAA
eukprot:CAMPEP_0173381904 /NCGR_PEP_ID=MMETSP1356-20130122/4348_1 /TAXON_ID=77927 ORGANISM="Hemiselmis virescens, Strain PCC157" /NCGR_SAMPLE_ID=MMETSP1356 /ASSEMBLY_ACC=CAM_ASM_000847 /LENGTH=176 /DNA_ID=CAMNT_0014335959 /DNA_START=13 /DNA_END=540 /DNA_ORIENTATION=+